MSIVITTYFLGIHPCFGLKTRVFQNIILRLHIQQVFEEEIFLVYIRNRVYKKGCEPPYPLRHRSTTSGRSEQKYSDSPSDEMLGQPSRSERLTTGQRFTGVSQASLFVDRSDTYIVAAEPARPFR
jgi:hypothetical protein